MTDFGYRSRAVLAFMMLVSSAGAVAQTSADETGEVSQPDRVITIHEASLGEGQEKVIGTVRVSEMEGGLLFQPSLKGLKPGLHGFHVHENPNCDDSRSAEDYDAAPEEVAAGAAGEHLATGILEGHEGPYGDGHLGDLPNLYVDESGLAEHPVYAPRLRMRDLEDRSLVVHANPDNYSDEPEENGGSGSRVACGAVMSDTNR